MARMTCKIATMEEFGLGTLGIEILLHALIFKVATPSDEEIDSHLRTVGIEDLQTIALLHEVIADELEAICCLTSEIGHRTFVTRDTLAHEVVGREVANLLDDIGTNVRKEHEVSINLRER